MVATVYGRYHYLADVLAGLLVGAAGYAAGLKLMRQPGAVATYTVGVVNKATVARGGEMVGLASAATPRMVL